MALALNALVPIHLAFDVAAAARHATPPDHSHSLEWRLLALATGHLHEHGHLGDHHSGNRHVDCAVCASAGTLAGFAPALAPVLPSLFASAAAPIIEPRLDGPDGFTAAPYRSRAPPIG